ncbi:MAG: hypothetical protein FWG36_04990 [Oscillospiraceae bacterium]|nr:hypothetical protein [Oscillospiraceae bacterium]
MKAILKATTMTALILISLVSLVGCENDTSTASSPALSSDINNSLPGNKIGNEQNNSAVNDTTQKKESPTLDVKSPLEIAQHLADSFGGTNVIQMAAEMIGADSGASFVVGEDKFEIYSFSDTAKLDEAKSGTLTISFEFFGDIDMNATVNGNLVLLYETQNEQIINGFKGVK